METAFNVTDISNTLLHDISQTRAITAAVVGVRIGSLGFLVPTEIYCEMLDKVPVNALPNVPPWLSGLLNLRGNLIPVFDLRVVLEEELPDNEQKKRRLFIIDRGDKTAALWIDGFPELKDSFFLQPLKKLPVLPQKLQRFVIEGFELDDQIWLSVKYEDMFKALGQHQFISAEIKI
jgi:twitching motility protein PilI